MMMIVASNSITVSNVNDGTVVHIAYADSADGKDGFYVGGGGRNLLVGIDKDVHQASSWWQWVTNISEESIKVGQPLCFSVFINNAAHAKDTLRGKAYCIIQAKDSSKKILLEKDGNAIDFDADGVSQASLIVPDKTDSISLFVITNNMNINTYYGYPKLEIGSVATPWSPAPSEAHPIYMGTYTDYTQADSLDPTAYQWSQIKGADGKDGVGIRSTIITYQLSSSGTTTPTGTWLTAVPTLTKGQYLWTRTTLVYTDNTNEDVYSVSYIAQDGNNGTNGVAGKDGVGIKSTTITYQSGTSGTVQPTGTWVDNPPSVTDGNYLWTRTVWSYTDGTSETGYSVAKIGEKGDKGDQGIPGATGADGRTSYLHIAYANNADGSGCTTSPDINSSYNYIGTYTDYTSTSSTDPSSYKWVAMFDSTKKRNFTSQPTTPYSVGDTWTQSGATYFCTTARASGAFTLDDWNMQQLTITSLASDVQTDLTNNVKTNKTYKGVTLNDAGLTATAGSTTVAMNSSDGFLIQKGTTQLLHADTAGNLTMAGNITAGNISGVNFIGDNLSLAGSLKVTGSILSGNGKVALSNTGVTIKGAGFNLGDSSGNTTVSMKDDGTFLANKAVLSGSLTSNAVTITGGDINMNGGKFHVDKDGNLTATSATLTNGIINTTTMNNSIFVVGNSYLSLLDGIGHTNVDMSSGGVIIGNNYRTNLDIGSYVTNVNGYNNNTQNVSTTNTADVTSPVLFTIDGSKLKVGDRLLIKLDINYNNYYGKLGTTIALKSSIDPDYPDYSQGMTTGFYTYNFPITWSKSFGTSKVSFSIKATKLQAKSNFYIPGIRIYNDHYGQGDNYFESSSGINADGTLFSRSYWETASLNGFVNKWYDGFQIDQGEARFSHYSYNYNPSANPPKVAAPLYEVNINGSGIRFIGGSSNPNLEFYGSPTHESIMKALGYNPQGIDYTAAEQLADGIYFDKYGNVHGYYLSGNWNITGYDTPQVASFPLNGKGDIVLTPPSGYGVTLPGSFTFKNQEIQVKTGSDIYFTDNTDKALAVGHFKSVSQSSLLSMKTNIESIEPEDALNTILATDIASYQYKADVGISNKRYASLIIDDVNKNKQYSTPDAFIDQTKTGRDDGSIIGYLIQSIKYLNRRIEDLENKKHVSQAGDTN